MKRGNCKTWFSCAICTPLMCAAVPFVMLADVCQQGFRRLKMYRAKKREKMYSFRKAEIALDKKEREKTRKPQEQLASENDIF